MSQNLITSQPLSPKQQRATWMLAQGQSQGSTALRLGVRRETVSRWNQLPAFRAEIAMLQREASEEARIKLRGLFNATVDALVRELNGGRHAAQVALAMLRVFGTERLLDEERPAVEVGIDGVVTGQ